MVRATASGSEAVAAFAEQPPDVLILDVGLPDADGRDVCQALRARGVTTPVLFLTARDALTDRLSGFHAGGDDYLTKPFALAELLVRVHALLRRAPGAQAAGDRAAACAWTRRAHAMVRGERARRADARRSSGCSPRWPPTPARSCAARRCRGRLARRRDRPRQHA